MKTMSEIGIFATRLENSSTTLKNFDFSLRAIKNRRKINKDEEGLKITNDLLAVITPIAEGIQGNLSNSININERNIICILKELHSREWNLMKNEIVQINSSLKLNKFTISSSNLKILENIADALDIECANIFQRIKERK